MVASARKRLAEVFADERSQLEKQWDQVDTVLAREDGDVHHRRVWLWDVLYKLTKLLRGEEVFLGAKLPAAVSRDANDTLGYAELLWTVRDLFRRALSKRWIHQNGKVEGYEFLAAKNTGWLVVYYSYDYQGRWYSGEFRRWLLINTSDREAIALKALKLFPHGSTVAIRIDPKTPDLSIAVAGEK